MTKRLNIIGGAAMVAALAVGLAGPASAHDADEFGPATLTGFASLPALTFVPASEPSGAFLDTAPVNGVAAPWDDQPVQGFSGIVKNGDGTYEVMSDNGFGNKANSGDFVLRIHTLAPVFHENKVDVLGGINLTDPKGYVSWPLTRKDRVLTGSDFDVESIQRGADGTYWIGDEFGPFLLHFDRTGAMMQAPISLPGVFAPENPLRGTTPNNINSSKGFEGMAQSPDGRKLYPLLEGTVAGDTPGTLRLNEFDVRAGSYTGKRYIYQLDDPGNAIGDAIAIDGHRFLIIERDNGQGDTAKVKKIYEANMSDRDKDGAMDKTLVADLMNIRNPKQLGGFGKTFTFPFQTIEDVAILDNQTIAVLNDNNFPGSAGRTAGVPDNNEFITLKLTQSLNADKRFL
ncbi:esterase-like activity of phytase family protein [Asanoa sp. NPDC050611]|uniref:esterase-like activity of phytase family protein n=1 Tax=Asanoa sp. NPDC050611 TaxID=3157098 RepID=UPI003404880E